jgi:ATP-dependent DNA ligase
VRPRWRGNLRCAAQLVDRRLTGIVMNDHTDARGELVFEQVCRMGLEGIVSKRLSKPYQSGRSGHWLKVNPDSPAMIRAREHFAREGP